MKVLLLLAIITGLKNMNIYKSAERLMSMNQKTWLRHMSVHSVWTRFFLPVPLMSLAIYARVWIGWYALVPLGLVLLFVWLNPRLFKAPSDWRYWGSRGVIGERLFINKEKYDIARHHIRAANLMTAGSIIGAIFWMYGLYTLDALTIVLGAIVMVGAKGWFVDRMVWITYEVERNQPEVIPELLR